jgi:hypothetical protein
LQNDIANLINHFSGAEVASQIGEVIFPARKSFCKLAKSFFQRANRFANLQNGWSNAKTLKNAGFPVFSVEIGKRDSFGRCRADR